MIKDALKYLQPNAAIPIDMATTTMLVNALKEALAQRTEQEPVAHCKVRPLRGDESFPKVEFDWVNQPVPGPLYPTPPQRTEQNFCSRCGKRTKDIHTCTPPKENI